MIYLFSANKGANMILFMFFVLYNILFLTLLKNGNLLIAVRLKSGPDV